MCNPVTTKHPELLLDKGVHQGYEWEVTANRIGYRCGYVRVPRGHPWHGKDYDSVEPYPDVHGGLTFAEPDTDCGEGGEDSAWWLGFDCAHLGDAPDPELPGYDARMAPLGVERETVKTTGYVAAECRKLAGQAAAAVLAPLPVHRPLPVAPFAPRGRVGAVVELGGDLAALARGLTPAPAALRGFEGHVGEAAPLRAGAFAGHAANGTPPAGP